MPAAARRRPTGLAGRGQRRESDRTRALRVLWSGLGWGAWGGIGSRWETELAAERLRPNRGVAQRLARRARRGRRTAGCCTSTFNGACSYETAASHAPAPPGRETSATVWLLWDVELWDIREGGSVGGWGWGVGCGEPERLGGKKHSRLSILKRAPEENDAERCRSSGWLQQHRSEEGTTEESEGGRGLGHTCWCRAGIGGSSTGDRVEAKKV